MLRKFWTSACALALLAGMVGNSFAAGIGSVIVADGSLTRLSDNSLEVLWNAGAPTPGTGDTTVDVGDRLIAIGRIDQVASPFPTSGDVTFPAAWNQEFTFASVIQVASVTPPSGPGGNYHFEFAPSTIPDPLGKLWNANTMIAFYSDATNDYTAAPSSINDGITRATNGTQWWELGAGPNYRWYADTVTNDINALASLPPGTNGGGFNFQVDLLVQHAGLPLIPVVLNLEMTGNGSLVGPPPTGGYQAIDNYDAFIRAVPEPGSMAIFGLLGIAPLARRFRRK